MSAKAAVSRDNDVVSLLVHHGYAPEVAMLLKDSPIIAVDIPLADVKERFAEFTDNYYMQFLALKLEEYGFNLNRPLISPSELHYAGNLIDGKMGNPPLDTGHLVALLLQAVDYFSHLHSQKGLNWQGFFEATYLAQDGSMIRGQDILRGLIKSDSTQSGAEVELYHHHFGGRVFSTLTMMMVVADALAALSPTQLPNINRFGKRVTSEAIKQVCALALKVRSLREPRLTGFFEVNAHKKIKQTLADLMKNLLSPAPDLHLLHAQTAQIQQDYYNPAMYGPDWQRFFSVLLLSMETISTPYAS